MGGWEVWAALIVGAAIWIIGHLLRAGVEESNRRGPVRPPPDRRPVRPGGAAGRPPQASAELDRFLEEVARRKQQAEQQRSREAPARRPAPARRQGMPERTPRRSPQAAPEVILVAPVRQRPSVDRPLETVVPVARPVRPKDTPATVVPVEPVEVVVAAPVLPAAPPVRRPRREASQAVQKLTGMLRSKDGLRTAFVLREILDPPLSRRHRRR